MTMDSDFLRTTSDSAEVNPMLYTNYDLFIVQSRLQSPHYMGTGRWIIVEPNSRASFVAVGKDEFPQILTLLLAARQGCREAELMERYGASRTVIDKLLQSSLLHHSLPTGRSRDYLSSYQRFVFEYPYHDYAIPGWKARDRAQMDQYGKQALPPPAVTPREGDRIALPPFDAAVFSQESQAGQSLSVDAVSALLYVAFAVITELESDWPMLRKTSPSGGGRHPAEPVVFLPALPGIPCGVYYYEVSGHALVRAADREYDATHIGSVGPGELGLCIGARVERPMWRYREPRSWRAVLIDIGHVLETVSLLADALGFTTTRMPTPFDGSSELAWLEEPELVYVRMKRRAQGGPATTSETKVRRAHVRMPDPAGRLLTNPFVSVQLRPGGMCAETLWPERSEQSIDEQTFLLMTYCQPSRRGDRPTDVQTLKREFALSDAKLDVLVSAGVLIEEKLAKRAYDQTFLWSAHNWYLSLLALLSARSSSDKDSPPEIRPQGSVNFLSDDLLAVLYARKTCRSFSDAPISLEQVKRILLAIGSGSQACLSVQVFGALLSVEASASGAVFEWNPADQTISLLGHRTDRSEIRNATIGQGWAGVGALTLWITGKVDLDRPWTFIDAPILLGQIGQRICLEVTRQKLGIFVTPAVKDQKTCQLLGIRDPFNTMIYTMTIGHERDRQALQ